MAAADNGASGTTRRTKCAVISVCLFFGFMIAIGIIVFVISSNDITSQSQASGPMPTTATTGNSSQAAGPHPAPAASPSKRTPAPGGGGGVNQQQLSSPALTGSLAPTSYTCNGLASLCDIPVNHVMFAMMHNANSDQDTALYFPNQRQGILPGLMAGIRGINVDIGICPVNGVNQLSFVHGYCFVGFSNSLPILTKMQQFLTDHPHEVIFMPVQIDDDTGGTVHLPDVYTMMQNAKDTNGKSFADRLYVHPANATANTSWPTLAQLIELDQRILFFQYNGAETCAGLGAACPPGFHDYFTYVAETAFEFAALTDLEDNPVPACTITRGGHGFKQFFGVNVFLEMPDPVAQAVLNNQNFLQQHLQTCAEQNDLNVSAVIVDFWEIGDLLQVVQSFNQAL